jgi:hypothetical protein
MSGRPLEARTMGARTMGARTMKVIFGVIALVATVALVTHADASTQRKKKRGYPQQYRAYTPTVDRERNDDDNATGYYEHRLEAVRFGSRRWWRIFDEHSGGSQHR